MNRNIISENNKIRIRKTTENDIPYILKQEDQYSSLIVMSMLDREWRAHLKK